MLTTSDTSDRRPGGWLIVYLIRKGLPQRSPPRGKRPKIMVQQHAFVLAPELELPMPIRDRSPLEVAEPLGENFCAVLFLPIRPSANIVSGLQDKVAGLPRAPMLLLNHHLVMGLINTRDLRQWSTKGFWTRKDPTQTPSTRPYLSSSTTRHSQPLPCVPLW